MMKINHDMAFSSITSQTSLFMIHLYDKVFEGTLPLKVESTQIVIDCLVRKQ